MTATFNSSEYKMIMYSFDYIRHNQHITTDQLPNVLIKFWSIPDFVTHPHYKTGSVQLIVFMFILKLHQYTEVEADDFLTSFRFNQLFYNFQVILATVDYCRNYKIKLPPFPIFDIEKYAIPDIKDGKELLRQYKLITGLE